MDRRPWQTTVHGVTMSWIQLSNFHFTLLEKGIATHTGILAWKIPWTEEPGVLQSMGSQRVGHD